MGRIRMDGQTIMSRKITLIWLAFTNELKNSELHIMSELKCNYVTSQNKGEKCLFLLCGTIHTHTPRKFCTCIWVFCTRYQRKQWFTTCCGCRLSQSLSSHFCRMSYRFWLLVYRFNSRSQANILIKAYINVTQTNYVSLVSS